MMLHVRSLSVASMSGMIFALLAAFFLPAPVSATTEACIWMTATCTDASGPGEPIRYTGRVWNCSTTVALYDVTVEDYNAQVVFFGPMALAPGEGADFTYEVVPDASPWTQVFFAVGWYAEYGRVAIKAEATCEAEEGPQEICRTPGFWGTRAGTEKTGSHNITQAVIDAAGQLSVCGEVVDNTLLGAGGSAIEAMCVSVNLGSRLQLARQLAAAALNCVVTNGEPDCEGLGIAETFARCDLACLQNADFGNCIDEIDCFNNGGIMLEGGLCQIGTCGGDGVTACDGDEACGLDALDMPIPCVPLPGNCHDALLVNEDLGIFYADPGPAGSSTACNSAIKNRCTVFDCD